MVFSGIPFLYYYLPAVLLIYFLVPEKWKNIVLLTASLTFYAWGEQTMVILFAAEIVLNWWIARAMERTRYKRLLLACAVVVDVGILIYFKYADFFLENINALFGISIPLLRIALPIGISFYTFQLLSYVVDVARGTVGAQSNLIHFGVYVSLFPQLIAGPIVRYSDICNQLTHRTYSADRLASGIRRFSIGLGKKVLIANVLAEIGTAFRQTADPSVLFSWLYAVSFVLQIYFDFSGYSDMAIGLGRILGFDFPENFRYPYLSKSITEFWRRWHITLGSWFRDYVYIPLGGSRKGLAQQLFNILIVWMLTGFWHGAAWNFILWGLFYAVLLMIEKAGMGKVLAKHPYFAHGYALLCVMIGFVLFQAGDVSQAVSDLSGMFGLGGLPLVSTEAWYLLRSYAIVFLMAALGAAAVPKRLYDKLCRLETGRKLCDILETTVPVMILLLSTAYLIDGSFNPFLYFRF